MTCKWPEPRAKLKLQDREREREMIGSEYQLEGNQASYTAAQIADKITPGSVVIYSNGKTQTQIFVREIDPQLILSSGLIITGDKITRDGFTDMRSHGKTSHFVRFSQITRIVSEPELKRVMFPYCQLRVR